MRYARTAVVAPLAMLAAACAALPGPPKRPDLTGSWVLTTHSEMGAEQSDLVVRQTGDAIAGTLSSRTGAIAYTGRVDGRNVAFGFVVNAQGADLRIDYSGVVEGDVIRGKTTFGSFGEGVFTAKRQESEQ